MDEEKVKKLCELAFLEVKEDELGALSRDLEKIVEMMDRLREYIGDAKYSEFLCGESPVRLRKDEPVKWNFDKDRLFGWELLYDYLLVPSVVKKKDDEI